jgi:hypothetical protein
MACPQRGLLLEQWLTCGLTQTTLGRACPTTPFPGSERTRTEIREGTRKLQVDTEGILMHIDRADEIAMPAKPAAAADPISSLGFVLVLASGTPAGCASFGAGRARDAGLLGFMGEIVDVASVFPLRHTAIVVPTTVPGAHAVRVANEERPDLILDTEGDDFAGGLVAQVAHAPLGPAAHLVLRSLQFLPTARMLFAAALLFGKLAELSASLPFEGADAAPGHHQRLAHARRDGGQVDFPQVDRRLVGAGRLFGLRDFHAHVQFKAVVPDERTGPGVFWKIERQDEGRAPFAHRQDDAPLLNAHRLGGPVDGVEAFLPPGILHAHLGMFLAESARGFNGAEQGAKDSLHRLAMQGEASFGQVMQIVLVGEARAAHSGLPVGLDADVPHLGRFPLRRFEATEEGWRKMVEPIHSCCFHSYVFFFSARKTVTGRMRASTRSGVAFIPPASPGRVFPLHLIKPNKCIVI